MLTGSTTDRSDVVEEFQNNPEKKIFLISLKAGGVGLNLTAADYIFILDPWWNPAAEMQAASRAHRIGQTKSVFVYRFITRNTVEEKIVKLQAHKENLAHEFVNSNNPMILLNKEQLISLVE
jgi:SNF2 family DNA or RNA helicase